MKASAEAVHAILPLEQLVKTGTATTRSDARDDPQVFERLFMAEYSRVVRVANRVLNNQHEAEEVAQEVFVSFHRRHPADAAYARPWLFSAASHAALNRLRDNRRRQQREERSATPEQQTGTDPEAVVLASEERRRVRHALAALPERTATVLVLRYSGLSYAEVAASMGVGIGQVGTMLRRAEQKLRMEVSR
ncbi:MAG: sigma-70 family RNA polymerase sigma factor [Candidatus Dormibacteria bacterium]